jgi:hypothetical protein
MTFCPLFSDVGKLLPGQYQDKRQASGGCAIHQRANNYASAHGIDEFATHVG